MSEASVTGLDLTILELIHRALRRDLARLAAALRAPTMDRRSAQALHAQWQRFARQLHGHHTAEDRLVWPVVERRANGAASDVLAAMVAEHATLDPLLDKVGAGFTRLAAAPGGAASVTLAADLAVDLDELARTLDAHLQHEERDAVPLLERYLTPADLDRVSATQRREAGLRGARQFLPWVLEGAPPADRARLMAEMPPPFRLLVRRWQRAHDREVARAFAGGGTSAR